MSIPCLDRQLRIFIISSDLPQEEIKLPEGAVIKYVSRHARFMFNETAIMAYHKDWPEVPEAGNIPSFRYNGKECEESQW
jgi:hypothetical protein